MKPFGTQRPKNGEEIVPARTFTSDLYDPVTNTFAHPAATASLNIDHIFATITPLPNGKVLIAGGDDPIDNSTDLYSP